MAIGMHKGSVIPFLEVLAPEAGGEISVHKVSGRNEHQVVVLTAHPNSKVIRTHVLTKEEARALGARLTAMAREDA